MIFLGVSACFAIISGICFFRDRVMNKGVEKTDYHDGYIGFTFIAIVVVILGLISSGIASVNQIDDLENVKKFEKVGAIYRVKAEALTLEFTKHLADAYPKHERDIYEKIGPDQVTLYLVKYPELRASETLMALVEQINKLQSDVYDQQVKSEEALQQTRVRSRNPWHFRFMIPTE